VSSGQFMGQAAPRGLGGIGKTPPLPDEAHE
jgi:hypothetical protein